VKSSENNIAMEQKYLKVKNSGRIEIKTRAKVCDTKLISIKIYVLN